MLRRQPIAAVKHIQEHEIRRPAMRRHAQIRLGPNTAIPRRSISLKVRVYIRHQNIRPQHLLIQEVVDDVHQAIAVGAGRTIDSASVEAGIRDVEGRFEEVLKLVQDVGDFGLGGAVVEEDDGAFAAVDELADGGPLVDGELGGRGGGHEGVGFHAGGLEGGVEHADIDVVAVGEE